MAPVYLCALPSCDSLLALLGGARLEIQMPKVKRKSIGQKRRRTYHVCNYSEHDDHSEGEATSRASVLNTPSPTENDTRRQPQRRTAAGRYPFQVCGTGSGGSH